MEQRSDVVGIKPDLAGLRFAPGEDLVLADLVASRFRRRFLSCFRYKGDQLVADCQRSDDAMVDLVERVSDLLE